MWRDPVPSPWAPGQRVSGAPVVAWAAVARTAFEWTRGTPRAYQHESDWPTLITRTFCGECGSTLTYERTDDPSIDVATSSMDDPDLVRPDRHVYASRKHAWVVLDDGLPQHDKAPQRPALG